MMKGSSLIVALLITPIAAFQVAQLHPTHLSTHSTPETCLHALSRRELLSSIPAVLATAAVVAAVPQRSLAADVCSYQGVFTDPKHPKGYRVLTGGASKATMQLQDDPGGTVYTIPIQVKSDLTTKLTIDFSVKGGPADVPGVIGSDKGVTTLTFPDGNVWKKETGVIGVYRDGLNPEYLRVIRKDKGSLLTVDLINGDKTVTVPAKAGSSKVTFDFPGKPNDPGTLDTKKDTISFGDGNVWTKL